MCYTISSTLAILSLGITPSVLRAEVPSVVADIPPVGALVAQVMGDLGAPEVLLTKGANPHDFQLRPSQARALNAAGLVVWVGPGLSPWLGRTLDGADEGAQLVLLQVPGTTLREFGGEHAHDHDHDHDDHADDVHDHDGHAGEDHAEDDHDHTEEVAADEADHDHEGHAHSGTDPHAWLDPANAAVWLGAIAAELSRLDPENAATYAANAAAGAGRLAALDSAIAARLAPVKDRPFVTFHDAYGYFTDHYGLTQLGAVAAGDAASPGAARLRGLQAQVGQADVCLFPEAQHDPALVTQMAEATGARLGGALDPEGTELPTGPDAYDALMYGLADTLLACFAR